MLKHNKKNKKTADFFALRPLIAFFQTDRKPLSYYVSKKCKMLPKPFFTIFKNSWKAYRYAAFPTFGGLGNVKNKNPRVLLVCRQAAISKKCCFVSIPKMLSKKSDRISTGYRKNTVSIPKMLPEKNDRISIGYRECSVPKPIYYIYNIWIISDYPYYIIVIPP